MPAFLLSSAPAASCQVRPSEPSWCRGSRSAQFAKTALTLGSVQDSLPAMSETWKS